MKTRLVEDVGAGALGWSSTAPAPFTERENSCGGAALAGTGADGTGRDGRATG